MVRNRVTVSVKFRFRIRVTVRVRVCYMITGYWLVLLATGYGYCLLIPGYWLLVRYRVMVRVRFWG